jgi:hypothetical protein
MPHLRACIRLPSRMENHRGPAQQRGIAGYLVMFFSIVFSLASSLLAYSLTRKLMMSERICNPARPGFLRAGRDREILSYFENRVTFGRGCPGVPVSYVGGTTGIPSSFPFCTFYATVI